MKALYSEFVGTASLHAKEMSTRSKVIAAGVAMAVAGCLSLPSEEVANPSEFFATQVLPNAKQLVAEFNEETVFDVRNCLELVRSLWFIRYSAAHPAAKSVYSMLYGFFDTFVGVANYVSEEQHLFLNTNKASIYQVSMSAASALCARREEQAGSETVRSADISADSAAVIAAV